MSQHSKYNDGKVLRSAEQRLSVADLRIMVNHFQSGQHTLADLRMLDRIAEKADTALSTTPFGIAYSEAIATVEAEVVDKNIVNEQAAAFLEQQALAPVYHKYEKDEAPDVLVSMPEFAWAKARLNAASNLAGMSNNRKRFLRLADVFDSALGYRMNGKVIEVEGDK